MSYQPSPGFGMVRIFPNSSLRKLARAMRRGKVPSERQVVIDMAVSKARDRRHAYLNSSPNKRAYDAKREAEKRASRMNG